MLKIRYLSDLHLEFIKPNQINKFIENIHPSPDEICVLAGDIGNPLHSDNNYDTFIKFINNNFKKIFIISGNHEYYNKTKSIDEINTFLVEYFKQFSNISFLNNTYEYYDNYCFIGTTLWSKITNPKYVINDVHFIKNFDYLKYNRLNMICNDFLENAVENNDNCIVITHHQPSNDLIDIKYKVQKMLPYNQWFYCDMDQFIEKKRDKIKCWIYGHTHMPSYQIIHGIPFLCNPIGYPNENYNCDFNKTFTLIK